MIIGVPAEVKNNENRIGLTPDSVKHLSGIGNEILVQDGADPEPHGASPRSGSRVHSAGGLRRATQPRRVHGTWFAARPQPHAASDHAV